MRAFIAFITAAMLALTGCTQSPDGAAQSGTNSQGSLLSAGFGASRAMATVPQGTFIEIALNSSLNSGGNNVGDDFTARVTEPVVVGDRVVIPAGSTVRGTVQAVTPAKRGAGNASMTLAFQRIDLPGGYSTNMIASLSERSASKKKRNAGIIGGSAAGGALLGRILGKDTKGAVVGSIVGGAIGTGVVLSKEGAQVNLPAGTELAIQLDSSMQVPGS